MRKKLVVVWACTGALLPVSALAQGAGEGTAEGAGAYCDYVEGEAGADAALMIAPELFGRVAFSNPGYVFDDAGSAASPGDPLPRVTAGVAWDLSRMFRGLAHQRRARAECRRYRAHASLESALLLGRDVAEPAALEARERVLRDALGRVEPGLVELRQALADQDATLDELQSYELRLDNIRQTLRETELERKRLAGLPQAPEVPLLELVEELRSADDEVEALSADVRGTSTWALHLRGGYDKIYGSNGLPVFAQVTLSWNTGALWQGAANHRARSGRSGWIQQDVSGAAYRAQQLVRELELLHASAKSRLVEVTALEEDLGKQLEMAEQLQTRAVRRFRDLLRFEHTRLRAEKAYLDRRVDMLGKFLDRGSPPPKSR